jgi:phenylalanyl-tRNA synthetase beta chain
MKISLHWLREWVDTGDDVPALAHALTMAGLEIEAINPAGPALEGIVVGEVKSVSKHPNAEKLNICAVSNGREELQIVCGAPNVRAGMKAPLALVGAKLPNGTEIKQATLRGVQSSGMLCSAREIGLSEDATGLLDLPSDLKTGEPLVKALDLDDTILEVNLTPNRGDCMSIAGVAREVSAARATPLRAPQIKSVPAQIDDTFPVRLEGGSGCPKLVGRVVRGVKPNAKSPFWMQERLRRAGLRPISAIVDITNYVMIELGQPVHAYDLNKLEGALIVRFAHRDEQIKLLDDARVVNLTPDVLMITDERTALGMAGVMGGEDSGIGADTTDILFEAAFFDPATVAGRGRRYGLITDASQRFERGVDPELAERTVERATQLLLDSAGGRPGPLSVTRTAAGYPAPAPIRLRHRRVEHVLGIKLEAANVESLLSRLGMKLTADGNAWQVVPPPWRFDLRIEEDLIEEVARLYGFDNIPERDAASTDAMSPWSEKRVRNERAADLLVDRGYQEAITYSFTDAAAQSLLFPQPALALSNPISAELAVMRVSLWPGLLQVLGANQRRQQQRVRLFEFGRRYDGVTGEETEVVAGIASGAALPEQWDAEAVKIDFFDVKGDVEALLTLTGARDEFRFEPQSHSALHPGQSARIWRGERAVGWLGALHPEHVRRLDLTYPVILFEIEVEAGLASEVPRFEEISRYPAIRRDIAVIVEEALPVETVRGVVRANAGGLLKELTVLSVYRGRQFEKGKKSIALGLQLQDTSRTLTDPEADALVTQIVAELSRQLHATIRDK